MDKKIFFLIALPAVMAMVACQSSSSGPDGITPLPGREIICEDGICMQDDSKMEWLQDAKFGMFIHWGIYAGPEDGEWHMERKGILPDQYRKLAYPESGDEYFAATEYDPAQWAALAKAAGMKYMNMTAEHHDGYALFASRHPNAFSSMDTHGRDFIKEYVDACREAGLRVGLYKTLINWRYPGYYDIYGTDCKKNRFGYVTDPAHKENARVMKDELYCQVRELMTNYGKIDQLFWDGGWLGQTGSDADATFFWESGKYMSPENEWPIDESNKVYDDSTGRALGLMGIVRKFQPDILVNPRSGWCGDYRCEEGSAPVTGPVRTEAIYEKCMTMGHSWGYNRSYEDPDRIVPLSKIKRMLSDCMVRNMNFLLNVGPDRFGRIPSTLEEPLLETGKWLEKVGEAVYGTRGGPWDPVDGQYGFTWKDNFIYVYFLGGYTEDDFTLPSLGKGTRVLKAYNLETRERVRVSRDSEGGIVLNDVCPAEDDITIIAVKLSRKVY